MFISGPGSQVFNEVKNLLKETDSKQTNQSVSTFSSMNFLGKKVSVIKDAKIYEFIKNLKFSIKNSFPQFTVKKLENPKKLFHVFLVTIQENLEKQERKKIISSLQNELDKMFFNLKNATTEKEKDEIRGKIQGLVTTIKTTDAEAKVFELIAQGKAKMVYKEYRATDNSVYYTPVGKDFFSKSMKKNEIDGEIKIGWEIEKKLGGKDSEKYISIDMEIKENFYDKKVGEYTVKTSAAEGDLENFVQKKELKFPKSMEIGLHILKGMNNMHKAGYVHGDIKGDNVLILKNKEGELVGRIADLGKTRKMNPDEAGIHVGNGRYAAPEGGISHRAEVYSTALMIIHALEGEFLDVENGPDMLINPDSVDPTSNADGKCGIEKYVTTNKECLQRSNTTLGKKVKILGSEIVKTAGITRSSSLLKAAQEQTDTYIDALISKLSEGHPADRKEKIKELGDLLKEMTRSDVKDGENSRTRSLEDAVKRYEEIFNEISKSLKPDSPLI